MGRLEVPFAEEGEIKVLGTTAKLLVSDALDTVQEDMRSTQLRTHLGFVLRPILLYMLDQARS